MEFTQIAAILAALAKKDRVEDILAAHGCSLALENGHTVYVEWEEKSNSLSFYSPVMDIPPHQEESFYKILLNTHLFGKATKNAYFGLNYEHGKVLLFQNYPIDTLDELAFFTALDTMVSQCEYWSQTLPQLL